MREYVITLIVTVSVCTLSAVITPDTEKGLSGYTRLVMGLCILCVAITPISSFIKKIYSADIKTDFLDVGTLEVGELESIYKESLDRASTAAISERLRDMICSNISVNKEDIVVFFELCDKESNGEVKKVTVLLSGKALVVDPRRVTEYVGGILDCECVIAYG